MFELCMKYRQFPPGTLQVEEETWRSSVGKWKKESLHRETMGLPHPLYQAQVIANGSALCSGISELQILFCACN